MIHRTRGWACGCGSRPTPLLATHLYLLIERKTDDLHPPWPVISRVTWPVDCQCSCEIAQCWREVGSGAWWGREEEERLAIGWERECLGGVYVLLYGWVCRGV